MESNLNERDVLELKPHGESERDVNEYLEIIRKMVMNSFQYKFGANLSLQNDILSFVWGQNFYQYHEDTQLKEGSLFWAASSLWSLTEQYEYLLTRLLQNQSFIPQIYGVCGPAYFVEFTETLGIYEYQLFTGWSQTWEKRAGLALQLMDLVQYLDTNLFEVLNLCDIKPDNFGLKKNGQLTLIDIDCALFDSSLKEQFFFTNCTKDADCDFFDCRGLCNMRTQRCYLKRTNNNMQALCEDVFVGYLPQFPTGLLRDPPAEIKLELFDLLNKCSFPDTGPDGEAFTMRGNAPPEVVASLQHLLKRSIQ